MTDLLNQQRKDHRKLRKALIEMAGKVEQSIYALDEIMKQPAGDKRGKEIASVLNYLNMGNDSMMHFTLGWGWLKIDNFKKKVIADVNVKAKVK